MCKQIERVQNREGERENKSLDEQIVRRWRFNEHSEKRKGRGVDFERLHRKHKILVIVLEETYLIHVF